MNRHRWTAARRALAYLALGLALASRSATAEEFHVAVQGDDSADGSVVHPFATIARARDAVRESLSKSPKPGPTVVLLHGGTYVLAAPILFTPADSGTDQAPIIYEAAPGEHPIVSGGRSVNGWKEEKDGMWTTEIPEVKAGIWKFRQLFVNGESRPRARTPNTGYLRVAGFPDGGLHPKAGTVQQRFEFKDGDIDPAWNNIEDAEVVVYNYWTDYHFSIKAIDRDNRIVTFNDPSRYPFMDGNKGSTAGARYIVNNVREALDEPGEWYLDRKTGVLSYLPKAGEQISQVQVVAPVQAELIDLHGDTDQLNWVKNIQFKRIIFEHTNFDLPAGNVNFSQGASIVPGAIVLEGAKAIRFEHCSFRNLGTFAFDLRRGCSDDAFVANLITHVAAGGFKINGGKETAPPYERITRLTITDNEIGYYGDVFASAVGLLVMNAAECLVAHNEVHHGNYTGISVGWTWGYTRSVSWNNRIEFNHIHDIGQECLSDLGGIYTLGISPGTVLRNNLIHGITCGLNYAFGIYHDEGSTHILDENNIVYDTEWAPLNINYGKEIEIRNNIFAFGRLHEISRGHRQPHESLYFENNIVYWKSDAPLFSESWEDEPQPYDILVLPGRPTKTSTSTFQSDWNVFFNPSIEVGAIKLGDNSWTQWRARGKDVHSLYTDPLFAAADRGDFQLKPDSPAYKMGFLPIDMSRVGPRETPGVE